MKRRKLMSLDERGAKVAETLGELQYAAVGYAHLLARDHTAGALVDRTKLLARRAVQYAKAIERARDER